MGIGKLLLTLLNLISGDASQWERQGIRRMYPVWRRNII